MGESSVIIYVRGERGEEPGCILSAELDVRTTQTASESDHAASYLKNLFFALSELVLHVNGAGGDEGQKPGPLRLLHSLPCSSNVLLVAPAHCNNHRNVPIIVALTPNFPRYHLHGVEVLLWCRGEPCLDDVHAQLRQLPRDLQLLLRGHGGAGGLLAFAKGGVQNPEVGRVRNVARDVLRPARTRASAVDGCNLIQRKGSLDWGRPGFSYSKSLFNYFYFFNNIFLKYFNFS